MITSKGGNAKRPFWYRTVAIFVVLILGGSTCRADDIRFNEVVQFVRSHRNPPELILIKRKSEDPQHQVRTLELWPQEVAQQKQQPGSAQSQGSGPAKTSSGSLLAGVVSPSNDASKVSVVSEGDVEGTLCDCGEAFVEGGGGGFPKWPLLFLAGIPLFFIHGGNDTNVPTPTPLPVITPTPTPLPSPSVNTPVPEPTSMFLLISGLAAVAGNLRRRRSRDKLNRASDSDA